MSPLELAKEVAGELIARDALAVVLMGSHVRGDAGPESDVDVIAIGAGDPYVLQRRAGYLLSISWVEADAIRESFRSPRDAPGAVPGWRSARILVDPSGVAASLQREARAWSWEVVGGASCDAYVAEEISGLAEEVHKLVTLLGRGNLTGAAVQRAILSFRLGVVLAIHLRLMFETENDLWNMVNERLGARWSAIQGRAFGLNDESFELTCRAALELYRLAVDEVWLLFADRQRTVVRYACRLSLHTDRDRE